MIKTTIFAGLVIAGLAWCVSDGAAILGVVLRPDAGSLNRSELLDAKDASTALRHRPPHRGALPLKPGEAFRLRRPDEPGSRIDALSFRILLRTGTIQEIRFRASPRTAYLLTLSTDPAVPTQLELLEGKGGRRPLVAEDGRKLPGPIPTNAWYTVKLTLDGDRFGLKFEGEPAFRFQDDGLAHGDTVFLTRNGYVSVDRIEVKRTVEGRHEVRCEDFERTAAFSTGAYTLILVTVLVSWLLAAAGLAGWIVLPGRLAFSRALTRVAGCFALATLPALAGLSGLFESTVGYGPVTVLGAWVLLAIVHLPRLRFPPPDPGPTSDESDRTRPRKRVFPVLAGLALFLLLAGSFGALASRRDPWLADRAIDPGEKARLEQGPLTLTAETTLDLGNRWSTGEETFRDLEIEGEVRLEPRSLLEIRVRENERGSVYGGLMITTMEDLGCRWMKATRLSFETEADGALPPATPLAWVPFTLKARGARLRGTVGGKALPEYLDGTRDSGPVSVLFFKGKGAIRNLIVTPRAAFRESRPGWLRAGLWGGTAAILLAAALAAWRIWSMKLPGRMGRVTVMDAMSHLPLVLGGLGLATGHIENQTVLTLLVILAAGARTLLLIANGRRLGVRCVAMLLVILVAGSIFGWIELRPGTSEVHRVNNLPLCAFQSPVREDLSWYQIPRLRRSNLYLRDHRFRDRFFTEEKPPGCFRVACMGSSSTFGHHMPLNSGFDWPTTLETILAEKFPLRKIEVMNCGIRGGNVTGVRAFFNGVVNRFAPDLLIIDLFYNDAYYQTLENEHDYLKDLFEGGGMQSAIRRWMLKTHLHFSRLRFARYVQDRREGETVPEGYFDRGVESFSRILEDTVREASAHGIEVLLVKEPVHGGRAGLNRLAYFRAMDAVGERCGVAAVNPLEAIRKDRSGVDGLFMDAVHLTRLGNRLMARQLARALERLGLIK